MKLDLKMVLASTLILVAGCHKDEISTTWVPKDNEIPAAMPGMSQQQMPPGHPPISDSGQTMPSSDQQASSAGQSHDKGLTWKLPKGWMEQPASAMRVGSFLATASNGQKVDISIVPLSGDAGGNLANINRWRGQIGLGPFEEKDLSTVLKTIHPGNRDMLLVDFVSEQNIVEGRYKKRLVAVIYTTAQQTWFFKMLGEDEAVRSLKPVFEEFLGNLKFSNHE